LTCKLLSDYAGSKSFLKVISIALISFGDFLQGQVIPSCVTHNCSIDENYQEQGIKLEKFLTTEWTIAYYLLISFLKYKFVLTSLFSPNKHAQRPNLLLRRRAVLILSRSL
jgi:hypothetical protein